MCHERIPGMNHLGSINEKIFGSVLFWWSFWRNTFRKIWVYLTTSICANNLQIAGIPLYKGPFWYFGYTSRRAGLLLTKSPNRSAAYRNQESPVTYFSDFLLDEFYEKRLSNWCSNYILLIDSSWKKLSWPPFLPFHWRKIAIWCHFLFQESW